MNLLQLNRSVKLDKPKTGILCLDCGQVLLSYTRHDYKTCGCPNEAMIDGGDDYIRAGAMKLDRTIMVVVSPPKPKRRKK